MSMKYRYQNKQPVDYSFWWAAIGTFLVGLFLWGWFTPKPLASSENRSYDPKPQKWQMMCASLQEVVDQYHKGEVGVFLKDLRSGRTFEYNADRMFISASLIKVPVMAATFKAIEEGKLTLNTKFKMKSAYRKGGAGKLKWSRSGENYSLSFLIYMMITQSDNTATAMVIDKLGYDYLNTVFNKLGLQTTRINPKGMSLANRLDPSLDNYTTAREMGSLLEKIYHHQVVQDGLSDLMIEIMKRANHKSRLAQNMPKNFIFARKTGTLRKNCHDMGIIYSPDGDYVMCVLTGENKDYQVAKTLISNVGKKAYEFMNQAS
ncbi:MAG: serine hydrolase [Elusimicrobiota bacterium]